MEDKPVVTTSGAERTLVCRMCRHGGSDVRLVGCGCTLHGRCVPLSLVISAPQNSDLSDRINDGSIPGAVTENVTCPVCQSGVVSGIYLFPMSLAGLDQAVELRKSCARAAAQASPMAATTMSSTNHEGGGKRKREPDSDLHEIQAESSYLLLSQSRFGPSNALFPDIDHHRTGRWSNEEIAFVDFIVQSFDQGLLPVPHGIKLNEFLGEMLLCKSSRLTKKMKNARLSTRSYELRTPPIHGAPALDCALMSRLQQNFLASLTSEPTRLELLFNITKLWRTHFSNLCLQIGYSKLDARDWVASLEEMESRASQADSRIRKARRRRMGLALKTEGPSSSTATFAADDRSGEQQERSGSAFEVPSEPQREHHAPVKNEGGGTQSPVVAVDMTSNNQSDNRRSPLAEGSSASEEEEAIISNMSDFGCQPNRLRLMSDDFSIDVDGLVDCLRGGETDVTPIGPGSHGAFLEEIMSYVESNNLPFELIDIWVPSFMQNEVETDDVKPNQLRLLHAGHITRRDLSAPVMSDMNDFGDYSSKFSFAPGVGLPGRVFLSGTALWERSIDSRDPRLFQRRDGAKMFGIKTAVGIPLTSNIGKLVIVMYSKKDLQEDIALLGRCAEDLAVYSPQPRWQLVIDTGFQSKALVQEKNVSSSSEVQGRSVDCVSNGQEAGRMSQMFRANSTSVEATLTAKLGINHLKPGSRQHVNMVVQNIPSGMSSSCGAMAENEAQLESSCDRNEELNIASLLGDHMPVSDNLGGASSLSNEILHQFMSLRLLLLRSPSRRSTEDNELIDILKKSFTAYSKDNRRSGSELASLLVKDWRFLKMTMTTTTTTTTVGTTTALATNNGTGTTNTRTGIPSSMPSQVSGPPPSPRTAPGPFTSAPAPVPTPSPSLLSTAVTTSATPEERATAFLSTSHPSNQSVSVDGLYQCHIMDMPGMNTFSSVGAPVKMPTQFLPQSSSATRRSSQSLVSLESVRHKSNHCYEGEMMNRVQAISADTVMSSTATNHNNANIVDET